MRLSTHFQRALGAMAMLSTGGWTAANAAEPAKTGAISARTAAPLEVATTLPNPRYTGATAIQEWTPEDTGGGLQNFSVTQAADTGLVYVGNSTGVLEFDGTRWRRLPPIDKQELTIRGLAVDDQGRVWAGFDNGVLRYSPDEQGRWRGESMLDRLSEAERSPGTVWRLETRYQKGVTWAAATNRIFRFRNDGAEARSWATEKPLQIKGVIDGDIWFSQLGTLLFRIHGDTLEQAPAPPLPKETGACLGLIRTEEGILQAECAGGIQELRAGAWTPFSTEVNHWLPETDRAATVTRRPDGGRIFSGDAGWLLFIDSHGQVLGRTAELQGLTFRGTHRTWLDRDGGLWIAASRGVWRVQVDGTMARHGRELGLLGGIRDLVYDSTLWLAGGRGWFSRDPLSGRFEQRADAEDLFAAVRSPSGGWLLSGGSTIREWSEQGETPVLHTARRFMSLVKDPRDGARVFGGAENVVGILRRGASTWQLEGTLTGLSATIYSLGVDERENLWIAGGLGRGLWRATALDGDWTHAQPERMDGGSPTLHGLPEATWTVAIIDGEAVLYSLKGIWIWDATTGRFAPDARYGELPRGATTPVWPLRPGARPNVIYVAGNQEYAGRYWRGTREQKEAPWIFTELGVSEAYRPAGLQDMCESPDGKTLWLGGTITASLDLTASTTPVFSIPSAQWREVRAPEGDDIYHGGATIPVALTLPLARRGVQVEFAAPSLRVHLGGKTGIEYRTRALGLDRDWTKWSKEAAREFMNLPPGAVRLEVQARNHLGVVGPVAALVLTVPPFWWETWWFHSLVALIAIALVAAVARWMVRRQFHQRIALLEAQAALQQERLRIARDMHDDLGSTLASIVHLSGTSESESGKAGDSPVLARIHEATRDLVHRTRDIVWAATPQHDSLESLIEQLAAHAERTLGDHGVEVSVELPARVPQEPLDATARHGLFLAFKEAVNNAAKYAQARTAIVRVELTADALVVTLIDHGIGFADGEKRGTGHGLANLRTRLAGLGGKADITSAPGRGTTVALWLPRRAKPRR